jgi:acetone carboxylase gamma subunit
MPTTKGLETIERTAASESRERIGAVMVRIRTESGDSIHCARCDHDYGPADRDPKLGSLVREEGIETLSPLNTHGLTDRMVARHFHCPGCGLTIAVDIQEKGDPVMLGNTLAPVVQNGGEGR